LALVVNLHKPAMALVALKDMAWFGTLLVCGQEFVAAMALMQAL
jgi:hypothetical protein